MGNVVEMTAQRRRNALRGLFASTAAAALLLAGCSGGDDSDEGPVTPAPDSSAQGEKGAPDDAGRTARGADLATTEFSVSWTDAVEAAQKNFTGDLAEIELEWQRGAYMYEVELVSKTEEYKVRIDADTGEQRDERTKKPDADDIAENLAEVVDVDRVIEWQRALKVALDAQPGTVNEWKLEGTERGPQYQFDIDSDSGQDYELTIDAVTGKLLEHDD